MPVSLFRQIGELYRNNDLLDFSLLSTSDNPPVRCHALVSCACSRVIRDAVQRGDKHVQVPGTHTGSSLRDVVRYFYSGSLTFTEQNVASVLYITRHLELNQLFNACITYACATPLTERNLRDMWLIAREFSLIEIERKIAVFIINMLKNTAKQSAVAPNEDIIIDILNSGVFPVSSEDEYLRVITECLTGMDATDHLAQSLLDTVQFRKCSDEALICMLCNAGTHRLSVSVQCVLHERCLVQLFLRGQDGDEEQQHKQHQCTRADDIRPRCAPACSDVTTTHRYRYVQPRHVDAHEQCKSYTYSNKNHHLDMEQKITELCRQSATSDISVVVNDKRAIKCHKLVLAARSTYFRRLFTVERYQNKSVRVCKWGPSIDAVIHYMYNNSSCVISSQNSFGILETSCELGVADLQQDCEIFIANNINAENCCDIFLTAYRLKIMYLIHSCEKYIAKHADRFSQSPFVEQLPYECVDKLLQSPDMQAANQSSACLLLLNWLEKQMENEHNTATLLEHVKFNHVSSDILNAIIDKFPPARMSKTCLSKIQLALDRRKPKEPLLASTSRAHGIDILDSGNCLSIRDNSATLAQAHRKRKASSTSRRLQQRMNKQRLMRGGHVSEEQENYSALGPIEMYIIVLMIVVFKWFYYKCDM